MDSKKEDEGRSEINSLDGILLRVDAIEEAVEINSANTEGFMRKMSTLLEEHIRKMEQRYTSSFGIVSAEIATANNNTVRVETNLTTRIVELERILRDGGTQGNFVPSLPLIKEMVNGAAAVLQVNVEAINRSTSSELKTLEEKVHSLQDRFEETERAQTVSPLGPGCLYDRVNVLEDMLHSMQNQQRLNSIHRTWFKRWRSTWSHSFAPWDRACYAAHWGRGALCVLAASLLACIFFFGLFTCLVVWLFSSLCFRLCNLHTK